MGSASGGSVAGGSAYGAYVPGLLSVVVPCYDVAAYLPACLRSLRAQAYADVEIIVVDDGSPDASARIARRQALRDPRIRVVRRPNGGLSAARNTGVAHARGEFLTFVDSDDVVSTEAFSAAIEALRESGSDFAVTDYDRLHADGRRSPAGPWIRAAHATRRLGATLESFPEAMVNAVAWSKVYRRSFWDRARLSFPEGRLYEDQPVSMAAYATARAFDVLPVVGVSWRIRDDRSSISQSLGTVRNLAGHNETVRESLAVLREHGHEAAAGIRAAQLLANNLPPFTRQLVTAGSGAADNDAYWALLREGLLDLMRLVPRERFVAEVRAQDKVLDELVLADRREDAVRFLESWGGDVRRFPTRRVGPPDSGRIAVDLPCAELVSAEAALLADSQLEPVHRVLDATWAGDDLVLTGFAYLRLVDLVENPPTVALVVVGAEGVRLPLSATTRPEPRAEAEAGHWYADYRPGGWRAVVPAPLVARLRAGARLEITVRAAGISRTEPVVDGLGALEAALAGRPVPVEPEPVLSPEEWGARNQRILREQAASGPVDDRAVFVHPRGGSEPLQEVATALAGHDLKVLWSVPTPEAATPPGVVPVVARSRAWHDAYARSAALVVEGHQPDWLVRRPEQTLVVLAPDPATEDLSALTGAQLAARTRRIAAWTSRLDPGASADDVLRALGR